ncbi:hypothetical protein COT68_01200 [bacterium (Candidatus Torokbacteria) CG09_land_8_20_14_0_10_42_11]|nr:MAG: hypothetical protein COT68_01200 [bacterium (Candidatus Torokbacteria) CG09_land_8_20_14_0_10_42_11]
MKFALAQKLILKTREYYEKHGENFAISRSRDWPLFLALLQYIKKGDKVLDLGCGSGRFYAPVMQKGANYLGVDRSKKLLHQARAIYPDAKFRHGDILDLKLLPASFDVIALIAVLHHLPSRVMRDQALQNVKRVLKPGGLILLTNWNLCQKNFLGLRLRYLWLKILGENKMDWNDILWKGKRYYHGFRKREIAKLLAALGFQVLENYYEKGGKRTARWKGENLVTIGKKIS